MKTNEKPEQPSRQRKPRGIVYEIVRDQAAKAGIEISEYVRRQLLDPPEIAPGPAREIPGSTIPDEVFWDAYHHSQVTYEMLKKLLEKNSEFAGLLKVIEDGVEKKLAQMREQK